MPTSFSLPAAFAAGQAVFARFLERPREPRPAPVVSAADLPEDRKRDLGLRDGRPVRPRDPYRD